MSLLTPAQIVSYRRLKDRSVSLTIYTQEVGDITEIDDLASREAYGILYFAENESISNDKIDAIDEAAKDLEIDHRRSLNERIRGAMWHVWNNRYKDHIGWEDYYKREKEKTLQHYKDQIDG